ncbi:oxidoreductase [Pseudonocardia sp. EC080610-09]|uniref:benzoate 1,2-dioxygenase electron transfer component BenC n=1 Tax=unclassified Pseudonocardia TaxID=2619320 RepID=UPI0006CB3193|nr:MULTISPECIES: benzoate 1,2-dioxygenase electron transfer component BenC [unclassified Pseudonocardia]ALE73739.1 oxidoreductase [Pseudonocardia sp. EC080625-04]ALL77126.1 oxidoreductase [Pseudonocardia sp. EC080610-09]ALL80040.1 oxidoreductase [Pseudonocardia sp. EC080619-01]
MTTTETRTHRVALAFEDGVTRFVNCREDQSVADASYRSRINIPVDCSDGACGTCKAFCESGAYDRGSYIEDALSGDEADEGYLLACQARPRSDLVVQIPTTSAVARTAAATHDGRITALDRLSPTTVRLTVEVRDRARLAFLPGQYVNIAVPGTDVHRSYSFSSGPDDEALTFLVKLTPGGVMSDWLEHRAAVGDAVSFTGPHGSFFLRESDAPLLLLAGGTGLAPILSILRTLRDRGSTRPVHLVYGVTTDDDVVELETVRELAGETGLTWDYCVADPATSAPNQGYVTALFGRDHLHDGSGAVYLCGPPAMVEAVRGDLRERELAPTGFYYEKFALAAVPDGAPAAGAAVTGPDPAADAVATTTDRSPATESGTAPGTEAAAPPQPVPSAADDLLTLDGRDGRAVLGRPLTRFGEPEPLHTPPLAATATPQDGLDDDAALLVAPEGARGIQSMPVLPPHDLAPLAAPVPAPDPAPTGTVAGDGYEIGEEHPDIHSSDAIFDARRALELGALELVLGRLSGREIAGYRLLAEATVPYVDREAQRFTDAHAYTESNAAFHDYLFTRTGNDHLLRAYQALGVKGAMAETLRSAVWCHPDCAQDHLDIVSAIEAGDRAEARRLVSAHARNSQATMRRAMHDAARARRPRFVAPGRFDGLVVLVTGAAQGIGEAVARRIGAEGGALVLADRSEQVTTVAGELGAEAVTADLEQWEGADAVVAAALRRYGRIDVAVHTVGGTIWAKPYHHYPPEQIRAEIDRSLMPTLWCCRAVAPQMVEQGAGTIVNVSSVATRGLNRVPYAAAKGGVNAITSALATELAPHGVRVLATAPGGTDAPPRRIPRGPAPQSAQEQDWYATIVEQTTESSLLKRYGTLDEQAAAITFLASPEASYITGTVLPVAGGDQG